MTMCEDARKFEAECRAEIDAVTMTEDDHFICEAAQQFGFHICNDDATVFSCDQEVLVAFIRRVIRHTKEETPSMAQPQTAREDIAQALCGADGNGFLCDCTPPAREAYMIRADAVLALSRPQSESGK